MSSRESLELSDLASTRFGGAAAAMLHRLLLWLFPFSERGVGKDQSLFSTWSQKSVCSYTHTCARVYEYTDTDPDIYTHIHTSMTQSQVLVFVI